MSLEDTDDVDFVNTGSLADLLGFNKTNSKGPKRLGRVASTKEISEAVVAIPFRTVGSEKVTFKIQKSMIEQSELILKGVELTGQDPRPDQSIIDMVDKMKKYVIPPHMDFVNFADAVGTPFAMYIFEFKQNLTQEDLSNIWQNLPPTSIGAAPFYHESDEVIISHKVFNSLELNLLNGNKLLEQEAQIINSQQYTNQIKWMVFKVKKRASTNYFDKTTNINDGGQFQFKFNNQGEASPINYNWPYDFFSMIELVKLDAEITMTPRS